MQQLVQQFVLSTKNPSKALQIQTELAGLPVSVLTLEQAGIEGKGLEEGDTLIANALEKARYAWKRASAGMGAMADDTGLFIDSLDGKPGAHSARWAGEDASTDEITAYTLKRLEGVADRAATFMTVAALIMPDGTTHFFTGEIRGSILEAPRVPPQPNMPYSHIFVPVGDTRTWAEMPTEEENAISHRGQAFRKLKAFLESLNLQ